MAAKENKNTHILSFGNKTIQQIIDKYGLNEKDVKEMLDSVCTELKKHIESTGVSLRNNIETVQSIVEDSALTILLKIDESTQQTEKEIKNAVQTNFNALSVNLLSQLKKWFDINAAQARKENKTILDALEKWGKECRFYAEQAKDAGVEFLHGFVEERKIAGMSDLRAGRHLLSEGKFDAAYERFNSAKSQDPSLSSEAYFYRALARCRIQPVWDSYTGSEVPLIYDIDTASLNGDDDFIQAVKDGKRDEKKRKHYIEFAAKVDDVLQEYKRIEEANKGGKYDYDCFICVKQSDLKNPALETDDFKWLKEKGLFETLNKSRIKTFAAYKTLKTDLPIEEGTNDYNAFILYALKKSKVLLLVCSDSAYAQTPWVKNEYTRFMNYHKNPQIVLVGDSPNITIPSITNKIQVLLKENINGIIKCVKGKIEEAKDYVDPERFYCEKCEHSYQYNDGPCTQRDKNGVKCNGLLLTAAEYANMRLDKAHTKLRDTENELERVRQEHSAAIASLNEIIVNKKLPLELAVRESSAAQALIESGAVQDDGWRIKAIKTLPVLVLACKSVEGFRDLMSNLFSKGKGNENSSKKSIVVPQNQPVLKDGSEEEKVEYVRCRNCGAESGLDAWFCHRCGYMLTHTKTADYPTLQTYDKSEFVIAGTKLKQYKGDSKTASIPYGVKRIGDNAFRNCSSLIHIEIPDTVKVIDNEAFFGCSNLNNIAIPNSVSRIGERIFEKSGICDIWFQGTARERDNIDKPYNSYGNTLNTGIFTHFIGLTDNIL